MAEGCGAYLRRLFDRQLLSTRTATYDVLAVETRFLKLPRSYDISGIPFHSDGRTVIKERIYLDNTDPNALYDEITVLDHALTRPYSKTQKATRNPRSVSSTDVCSGKQYAYRHRERKLFPQRGRQADAAEEKPGTAGFALFQANPVAAQRVGGKTRARAIGHTRSRAGAKRSRPSECRAIHVCPLAMFSGQTRGWPGQAGRD